MIVPLRPDVNVEIEEDRRQAPLRDSVTTATHERRGGAEQLTLFDEPHDR